MVFWRLWGTYIGLFLHEFFEPKFLQDEMFYRDLWLAVWLASLVISIVRYRWLCFLDMPPHHMDTFSKRSV